MKPASQPSNSHSSSQASQPRSSSQNEQPARRSFTHQFKLMAVNMYERIGSIRQVARSLKINRKVFRIWIRNKVIIHK
jgi:transposase-like protein